MKDDPLPIFALPAGRELKTSQNETRWKGFDLQNFFSTIFLHLPGLAFAYSSTGKMATGQNINSPMKITIAFCVAAGKPIDCSQNLNDSLGRRANAGNVSTSLLPYGRITFFLSNRLIIPIYCASIPHRRSTSFFWNYSHNTGGVFDRFSIISVSRCGAVRSAYFLRFFCNRLFDSHLKEGYARSFTSETRFKKRAYLRFELNTFGVWKIHIQTIRESVKAYTCETPDVHSSQRINLRPRVPIVWNLWYISFRRFV